MAWTLLLGLSVFSALMQSMESTIVIQKQYPGCPEGCECKSSAYVICDQENVDLTYIPGVPKTTTTLVYRTNSLGDVYMDTFQNISTRNGIKIETLDLTNNDITSISPMALSQLTHLKTLDLSQNYLMSSDGLQKALVGLKHINLEHLILKNMDLRDECIPRNLFQPLTLQNSLLSIDLSQNSLVEVDVRVLANLTSLQEFILKENRLAVFMVVSESLEFPNLQTLDLRSNSLSDIPLICFQDFSIFPNLQKLLLEDNFITVFQAEDLSCLSSVEEMSLGQNPAVFIPENLIRNMTSLKTLRMNYMLRVPIGISARAFTSDSLEVLSLVGNELTTNILVTETFSILNSLIRLDLTGNDFNSLSEFGPAEMSKIFPPNLEDLSLRNCRLTCLPRFNHQKLEQLDVSENKISVLEKDAFSGLRNLTVLNLISNRFVKLNESTFPLELRDRLSALGIDDNPLICSCAIAWIQKWMGKEPEKFFTLDHQNGCIKPDTSETVWIEKYSQDCRSPLDRNVNLIVALVCGAVVLVTATFVAVYYRKSIRLFCYLNSRRRHGDQLVSESETSSVI